MLRWFLFFRCVLKQFFYFFPRDLCVLFCHLVAQGPYPFEHVVDVQQCTSSMTFQDEVGGHVGLALQT